MQPTSFEKLILPILARKKNLKNLICANWLTNLKVGGELCNTLVRLTNAEYEKLLGKKSCGQDLTKKFLSEGLLIEKDLNELMLYERWAKMQRKIDKPYFSVNYSNSSCNKIHKIRTA